LPLAGTELLRPAVMVNLLGDVWERGEPDWAAALSDPWVKLHLYGKLEPRVGRKMGHLTALGENVEQALQRGQRAKDRLQRSE
jgi:5-(carboxyamino)imidazole ribonucleotide synthase